jgi:hypothetical protein
VTTLSFMSMGADRLAVRAAPWTATTFTAVVVFLSVLCPHRALASCNPPPFTIVWSSPADGATEVPTNAVLWVLTSTSIASVSVDGQDATAGELPFSFKPAGILAPLTEHTVAVTALNAYGGPTSATFRFTTAIGPQPAMAPGQTDGVAIQSLPSRSLDPLCQGALNAMACNDTGQDAHLVFHTTDRPLLWLVEPQPVIVGETPTTTFWPGSCGDPDVFTHQFDQRCYNLVAADQIGGYVRSGPFCPAKPAPSMGCSISGPNSGIGLEFVFIALGFGSLARRRGRR